MAVITIKTTATYEPHHRCVDELQNDLQRVAFHQGIGALPSTVEVSRGVFERLLEEVGAQRMQDLRISILDPQYVFSWRSRTEFSPVPHRVVRIVPR